MSVFNIIEFTLLTSIAYIVARFLLGNTKYYDLKRAYILSITPVLFFLSFTSFGITSAPIVEYMPLLPEIIVTPNQNEIQESLFPWLIAIYTLGFLVSLIHKGIGIRKIKRIIAESTLIKEQNGIKIYENNSSLNFCFWRTIAVAKSEKQDLLVNHELEHIANKHHYDLLLSNIYSIVFWFNPFTFLMTKEIQATHEFQVDSKSEYKLSEIIPMISKTKNVIAITSNHNLINYKRRIEMKTSKRKYIPSLIAGVMLTLFAISVTAVTSHSVVADEITTTDKVPTYKGNMMAKLSAEIKYPKSAYEDKAEGMVVVKVKIDADGKQVETEIARSSKNTALDEEALRAVKTLEDWNAGTVGGKAIAAWVQIPVKFKLPK